MTESNISKDYKAFKLKRPCKHCPFRTDLPEHLDVWLGEERATSIAHNTFFHGQNFPCHKTVTRDNEYDGYEDDEDPRAGYRLTEKESQCAGAAIMQIKTDNLSQWMQIAQRMNWSDADHLKELDLDSPVFASVQDFIDFHTHKAKKNA